MASHASEVHRDRELRVPQHVHDHPWRHVLGQEKRRAGMPQVMKPDPPNASPLDQLLQPSHALTIPGEPCAVGESSLCAFSVA
jgi:hypothetical protein